METSEKIIPKHKACIVTCWNKYKDDKQKFILLYVEGDELDEKMGHLRKKYSSIEIDSKETSLNCL